MSKHEAAGHCGMLLRMVEDLATMWFNDKGQENEVLFEAKLELLHAYLRVLPVAPETLPSELRKAVWGKTNVLRTLRSSDDVTRSYNGNTLA
ncbi:MAG: hypothetical protein JSS66_07445 [Armatimonadetes bacterium]|nr:hypothetical protein [Armatimonadota bacterium]